MLQPAPTHPSPIPTTPASYTPTKTVSAPVEQGTIGRSVLIKGNVSGSEPLYIDGCVEGTIYFAEHRVTIGRHGNVSANINAKEVVIMGTVKGNIECSDRLDIRADGSLTGDVVTRRISVEEGAVLRGSVQVQAAEHRYESKHDKSQPQAKVAGNETLPAEKPKTAAAAAGA